jgi:4-methyl-5(b-hydroxyethyl)-thiazole monophosphate biosynthesis
MVKALLFLATGFEEIESMCVVDTLRRAGITIVLAGLQQGPIVGSRGVQMIPDSLLDELTIEDFDAVILPGGSPGYINLGKDERVLEMVMKTYESGKLVAAICGGPSILGKLGIVRGRRATIFPGKEAELIGAEPVSDPVVVDGNVVTSRGPGTALEFAIKLIELLVGEQKAREVKRGLVMSP